MGREPEIEIHLRSCDANIGAVDERGEMEHRYDRHQVVPDFPQCAGFEIGNRCWQICCSTRESTKLAVHCAFWTSHHEETEKDRACARKIDLEARISQGGAKCAAAGDRGKARSARSKIAMEGSKDSL